MSFVSSDSAAWLDEFLMRERIGDSANLRERSAREVDALIVLQMERRKWEIAAHGE